MSLPPLPNYLLQGLPEEVWYKARQADNGLRRAYDALAPQGDLKYPDDTDEKLADAFHQIDHAFSEIRAMRTRLQGALLKLAERRPV